MATAGIVYPAAILGSAGARLLPLQRTLATKRTFSLSPFFSSKLGLSPLQLTKTTPPRKFVIRAARTESKGVSLGFRAPEFQLPEPLTGKMWKLDDFESYPALLQKGLAVVAISSNSVATHPQDGPKFMAEEAEVFKYPFPYLYDEDLTTRKIVGRGGWYYLDTDNAPHPAIGGVIRKDKGCFMAGFAKTLGITTNEVVVIWAIRGLNLAKRLGVSKIEGVSNFNSILKCNGNSHPPWHLSDSVGEDGRRPFELVYHGQFDDSRPSNNVRVTGRDLSLAIDCVLSGQPVPSVQKPRCILSSSKWLLGIPGSVGGKRMVFYVMALFESLQFHLERLVNQAHILFRMSTIISGKEVWLNGLRQAVPKQLPQLS
ncbi:hypothetical protein HHK36_009276 [Tetracentron sinense]|uniref:RNase H type-1 domain-containing protein n=1 Tax=Tetracentron sinense TaxID=13715 RepID=A0A834ZFZ0_TETSI|nr:hypothetical protein HHK36_009276 [Tetracentron sinense]